VLSAELAGTENPPKRNGYAAAVYGLTVPMFSWPGIKDWWNPGPLQLAQYLPNRIWRSFAAADPLLMNACILGETNVNPPESERAAFEAAKVEATQAAKKLLDATQADPDGILGPYLKGLSRTDRPPAGGALFLWTPVEGLMQKRPDLFQAAAANEEAMAALWKAGENAPSRRNTERLMKIAWAIQNYARAHDEAYPDRLDALFKGGHLTPPLENKSLVTGRPYTYVAANEKSPSKANDRARFILLYDDNLIDDDWYVCAFASCLCNGIRVSDLKDQLRQRGK
jgi:hypothetical protein